MKKLMLVLAMVLFAASANAAVPTTTVVGGVHALHVPAKAVVLPAVTHGAPGILPGFLLVGGTAVFAGLTYCVLEQCTFWQDAAGYVGLNTYADYPK